MALKKKESMRPHPSLVGMSYFPITHQTSPRRCGIPEAELYFRGIPLPYRLRYLSMQLMMLLLLMMFLYAR